MCPKGRLKAPDALTQLSDVPPPSRVRSEAQPRILGAQSRIRGCASLRTRLGKALIARNRSVWVTKGSTEHAGTRTQDLRIKSPLLYQLSYVLAGRGREDRRVSAGLQWRRVGRDLRTGGDAERESGAALRPACGGTALCHRRGVRAAAKPALVDRSRRHEGRGIQADTACASAVHQPIVTRCDRRTKFQREARGPLSEQEYDKYPILLKTWDILGHLRNILSNHGLRRAICRKIGRW